jgi:hypothetical protein
MWDGLKDATTGYFLGIILELIVFMGLGTVAQRLLGPASVTWITGRWVETAFTGPLLAMAAWWGARGVVRSMSRRSLRRSAALRAPIAIAGAVPITLMLVVWPLHYTWAGIAAMLAVPVSWAVAAITSPELGGPRSRWTIGRPSARLLGTTVIAVYGISLALYVISPSTGITSNESGPADDAMSRLQDQQQWVARGYTVVAPAVIDLRHSHWNATAFPDRNGNVALTMSYDTIDWDQFADLRVEAWSALPTDGRIRSLDPRAAGPYAVVPLHPWDATAAIVPVGSRPGIAAYLLFVTGVDRTTAARVAIGSADGEEVEFTGTIIEWFTRLGP